MLIRRRDAAEQALRPFAAPRSSVQTTTILGEVFDATRHSNEGGPSAAEEAEMERLHGRLEHLEAALEDANSAREAAVEVAIEQGREEGRRGANELGTQRLQALRKELARASQECLAKLEAEGDLAIAIARAAVRKILGEATPRAALAEEIVRAAIAQIAAGSVIAVRVSGQDFAAQEELAALERELGPVRIARDEGLPSGGCELELTLGTTDASLEVQLAALDRELSRFGASGCR